MRKKTLRSGYTTGACASAAAKAAAILLMSLECGRGLSRIYGRSRRIGTVLGLKEVEIPFPDGSRVKFRVHRSGVSADGSSAWASVIKDAGDDPDVTNGAEITATVALIETNPPTSPFFKGGIKGCVPPFSKGGRGGIIHPQVIIKGGKGVGRITKPGLSVSVGEAAINPVPGKMIKEAVVEAINETNPPTSPFFKGGIKGCVPPFSKGGRGDCPRFTGVAVESGLSPTSIIEITISVPDGEKLAKKTLNERLGIVGGISILGTTGIVRPISSEAWTATISASMDVAKAMGHDTIVLSAGRASEKAHIKKYNYPEESYVMMGDYLEFALLEAKKHGFREIHLCAQWAKMLKIAMAIPQTHVRHGAIDIKRAVEFLEGFCQKAYNKEQSLLRITRDFNTAREIFDFINLSLVTCHLSLFSKVCSAAKKYTDGIASGIPVTAHLVSYEEDIIAGSE